MYRLLVVCSLTLAAGAQYSGDPAEAAILAETRQLNADGSSDVAYAQEDGVLFKETTSKDGERRGSYEYVGDDGKKYRVEYVAGAGGFQIVSSTHVDKTPDQPRSAPQPAPAPRPAASQPTRANTNTFNINYDLSQPTAAPAVYAPVTAATTTTTTTRRPVRKNFHTGKVSLERNDKGYVYSYTHNG